MKPFKPFWKALWVHVSPTEARLDPLNGWGTNVPSCPLCGALVSDPALHSWWHAEYLTQPTVQELGA